MKRRLVQFIVGLIISAIATKVTSLILGDDAKKKPKTAKF